MKKLLILLALLILLLIPSTCALAQTTSTDIQNSVTSHKNIKSAKVLIVEDNCIIAIQPQGIVTRTEYEALVDELIATVCDNYTDIADCHITRSVKAYRLIDKVCNLAEDDRQLAIDELVDKLQHSPMTLPNLLP